MTKKKLTPEIIDRLGAKAVKQIASGRTDAAFRTLRENGLDDVADAVKKTPKPIVSHDLRCPVHQAPVVSSCKLKTCKFWVESKMANHCLLAYTHQQSSSLLSLSEISYIYGQPLHSVRNEIEKALDHLRENVIRHDALDNPDIERAFWFVETPEVCCVCGSLTDDDRIDVPDFPFAYCSDDCLDKKPIEQLVCEHRFGLPMEKIVRWAIHRFKNLPMLERTLDLKRETMIEMCRLHLGRELSSFFPKVKINNERPPWRRKASKEAIETSRQAISDATTRQTARLGRPEIKTDLSDRLKTILD